MDGGDSVANNDIRFGEEYYVLKYPDGNYLTDDLRPDNRINRAVRFDSLREANQKRVVIKIIVGIECEVVPVSVTVQEIKKREILIYCMLPSAKGWGLTSGIHMGCYWSANLSDALIVLAD